jgi:EmrB/QacA subfamily drug resistance transporter
VAIVNVALPSIGNDLGFDDENLQWVVTAYALTFGGFLLLGGRAADLLGRRLIFMVGLALFTLASFACGLAQNEAMLIGARAVQGLGAAVVSPAALSIISVTFTEGKERNKALGAWGAVAGSGAAAGVLFGGILTKYLGWEWIFFVNIPVGIVVLALTTRFVRESRAQEDAVHDYDVVGALTVTSGLVLLVYAISEAPDVGWAAFRTIGLLVLSGALLLLFVWWESRAREPLMPLGIFRNRMVTAANVVSFLLAGGMFGSFLLLTLYMQEVLRLSVLQTGVAFLATAGTAVVMAGPAQMLVTRFGPKLIAMIGLSLLTAGALWYTQIDVDGSYPADLLPGFLMVGVGIPFSFIPVTIAALAGVPDRDAGLASGLLNTAQQVGGAIGVAVISTVAFTHFEGLLAEGNQPDVALTQGFQWGFWLNVGIWAAGLLAAAVLIRRMELRATEEAPAPTAV